MCRLKSSVVLCTSAQKACSSDTLSFPCKVVGQFLVGVESSVLPYSPTVVEREVRRGAETQDASGDIPLAMDTTETVTVNIQGVHSETDAVLVEQQRHNQFMADTEACG